MKKAAYLIMALSLALCLCACVQGGEVTNEPDTSENSGVIESENETTVEDYGNTIDYTIVLNGNEYNFPISYEEFIGYGWEPMYIDEAEVSTWTKEAGYVGPEFHGGAGCYTDGTVSGIWPSFYNNTSETLSVPECLVVGVIADYRDDTASYPEGTVGIKMAGGEVYCIGDLATDLIEKYGDMTSVPYDGDDLLWFSQTGGYGDLFFYLVANEDGQWVIDEITATKYN